MKSAVFALSYIVLCMGAGPSTHLETRPCALVCVSPDEKLDARKCSCVKQADSDNKACGLVCPNGQTLDAAKCLCVGKN
jgi:hypothetical protein